jgi:alpha-beta hydrolase superfamily lysophospholipase
MRGVNGRVYVLHRKATRRKKKLRIVLMILCAVMILFSIGSVIAVKILYDESFRRADRPQFSAYLRYEDIPEYDRRVVQFKSGRNTLTGYLYGEGNGKGLVVIAHGLGGGAENYLAETIYFVDQGWAVFAYDCTGSHASEGDSTVGLAQSMLDLDAALTYIEGEDDLNHLPVMLFGHSWGGFAVASVLNYDHPVAAAASVAGFNSPIEMTFEQGKRVLGWFAYFEYPYMWLYQTMLFGKAAWASAVDGIDKAGIPVMIIHGDEDSTISYTGAAIIAHRDEITNPRVVYKTCSTESHNGHSSLFYSEAAIRYMEEKNREYRELYDSYGGEIPDDVKVGYYAGIDRFLTSEPDRDFMDDVNQFFESALEGRAG